MPIQHEQKKKVWLSPTGIELSKRCPRCFWLHYRKKIRQPEGIVSRLANRFDFVIKKYFDQYRASGQLPPMVREHVEGKLQNPFREVYFYHYNDDYGLMGKLDECLVREDGAHTPVDHKTASSDPNTKDIIPAYQTQLDTYAFLMEKNRLTTSGIGHLIFVYPEEGNKLHEGFPMQITVKTLQTDPQRAFTDFLKSIQILEKKVPQPSKDCPFCSWRKKVGSIIRK
ncbi:MAG: PD-(D/E)XK nuclease family protein [Patescibacteria group bacterium]|nr:PD-(D/E)XK nuclease family protein [Patescibacteria group bacterium]